MSASAADEFGMHDDQLGLGVRDDVRQQAAAIGDVDRHVDRAEIVDRRTRCGSHRARSAATTARVALLDAERCRPIAVWLRDRLRLAIGPFAAVGEAHEHLVRRRRRMAVEQRPQHATFGVGHARIEPGSRHRFLRSLTVALRCVQ